MENLRKRLESETHQRLYRDSLASVLNRLEPDGYFQESLTGRYSGMFPRTVGPLVFLLLESGRPEQARAPIEYCLQGAIDNELERVPHVIDRKVNGKIPLISGRDEIDGQAHVILGWARLTLSFPLMGYFEEQTYSHVATLMDRTTDEPHLLLPLEPVPGPVNGSRTGLVRNSCFEHSRDNRYWDTSDLLTQAFVLAALEEMVRVALRRGDDRRADRWKNRLERLAQSVGLRLTRDKDGRQIYLEMRLPDGYRGVPYEGMSWVMWSPVAAGWRGVDRQVLRNTIEAYRSRAVFQWHGHEIIDGEWWPTSPRKIIGKALAWEMIYEMEEGDITRVCECLDFLGEVNKPSIYLEFAALKDDGIWEITDPGNGEQCVWLCWAIQRLRKAAGLE